MFHCIILKYHGYITVKKFFGFVELGNLSPRSRNGLGQIHNLAVCFCKVDFNIIHMYLRCHRLSSAVGFSIKIIYAFLVSLVLPTRLAHLIVRGLITKKLCAKYLLIGC